MAEAVGTGDELRDGQERTERGASLLTEKGSLHLEDCLDLEITKKNAWDENERDLWPLRPIMERRMA